MARRLKGWDGDPRFWRAENGAIVGETTPDKKLEENTFMIWKGGEPADFELKVEFRITAPTAESRFAACSSRRGNRIHRAVR